MRYYIIQLMVLSLLTSWALSVQAAVYQVTDGQGHVIYTDNLKTAQQYTSQPSQIKPLNNITEPMPAVPMTAANTLTSETNANSITVSQLDKTSSTTLTGQIAVIPTSDSVTKSQTSQRGDYQLQIKAPQAQQVFHQPQQTIAIQVNVKPALKSGDSLVYALNDRVIATTTNTTYDLSSATLAPNNYQLKISIINNRHETIATAQQAFYLLPNNYRIKQQRQTIAAKQRYEQLPWYKKMLNAKPAH